MKGRSASTHLCSEEVSQVPSWSSLHSSDRPQTSSWPVWGGQEHASARVQRWAITLSAYSYTLQHRPGRENSADALSCLPLPYEEDETYDINCVPEEVNFLFSLVDQAPLSAKDIAKETQEDITLKAVFQCVSSGWPAKSNDQLRAFAARKNELSLEKGCILWGTRVVIPSSSQTKVLQLLHDDTHVGVAHMKSQARSWVWWPQIDADIEKSVRCCYTCQKHKKLPGKAPLFPWEWPEEPWKQVHLDFAGPFLGHMYFCLFISVVQSQYRRKECNEWDIIV